MDNKKSERGERKGVVLMITKTVVRGRRCSAVVWEKNKRLQGDLSMAF